MSCLYTLRQTNPHIQVLRSRGGELPPILFA